VRCIKSLEVEVLLWTNRVFVVCPMMATRVGQGQVQMS